MRLSSSGFRASILLTSLWQAPAEKRRQNDEGHHHHLTAPISPAYSEQMMSPSISSRGYPFSSAGVPRETKTILAKSSTTTGPRDTIAADNNTPWPALNDETESPNLFAEDEHYQFCGGESEIRKEGNPSTLQLGGRTDVASRNIPPLRTQIVYRYYARQKTRTASSGSIPFILIGPNVDHWKVTGQQLSARGFNVIAVGPKDEISAEDRRHEGPGLVLQLMDALRWNKVVLVGCDSESTLAIQAAMHLAPERVVGLILCGRIDETENTLGPMSKGPRSPFELDRYLHERLQCPFTIIWDGNTEKPWIPTTPSEESSSSDAAGHHHHHHRSVIIGGGSAPHRRRPGIFAWVLTRFVEEKIAPAVEVDVPPQRRSQQQQQRKVDPNRLPPWRYPAIELPWRVDEMFNEESMVVFGRVAATALFYAVALKVMFYQYDNIRGGVDFVTTAKRNAVATLKNRASKLLSLFLVFRRIPTRFRRRKSDSEDNEGALSTEGADEGEAEKDGDSDDPDPGSEPDEKPAPEPERDLSPIFFLDHVVA